MRGVYGAAQRGGPSHALFPTNVKSPRFAAWALFMSLKAEALGRSQLHRCTRTHSVGRPWLIGRLLAKPGVCMTPASARQKSRAMCCRSKRPVEASFDATDRM